MGAAIVQHSAPTSRWRRHTQAEKAHSGFSEDCAGHADGRLHHDRLNNVGQNVARDDAEIAGTERAGGFHIFAFAGGQHLSADKARIAHPASEREGENKIENAGTAEGDESNGQKNSGERQERIHDDDIDEAIEASAVVAGGGADEEAEKRDTATTQLPTSMEMREPKMRRERMSRPSSSVPHQWVEDGLARRLGRSMYAGFCGAIHGAKRAKMMKMTTRTTPIAASGLLHAARRNEIAVVDIWKICYAVLWPSENYVLIMEDDRRGPTRMRAVNLHL